MPRFDRSALHDVHIFDRNNPSESIAGLTVTRGMTNRTSLEILIVPVDLVVENDAAFFYVNDEQGTTIEKNDAPLQQGNYYIVAQGEPSIAARIVKWLNREQVVSLSTMSLYSRELCPSRAQEHGHLETELGQGIQNATFPDSPSRQPDSL
jgi:hypothetical protein